MAALLIKNLPPALHESLRARAERNRRSMTQEVLTIIERTLNGAEPMVPPVPSFRTFKPRKPIPPRLIETIIREARDRRP